MPQQRGMFRWERRLAAPGHKPDSPWPARAGRLYEMNPDVKYGVWVEQCAFIFPYAFYLMP